MPGFKPSQWNTEPQLVFIEDELGALYFFDAVFRTVHYPTRVITEHPIQTGANISDHSYQLPTRVSIEIGMSDVMDIYTPPMGGGQSYSSDPSKSKSAYQTFLGLQMSGQPFSLYTRLQNYQNMVIESMPTEDDIKTRFGLRATISMRQIFTAEVSTVKVSTRPQAVQTTNSGSAQTQPLPSALKSLYDAVAGK